MSAKPNNRTPRRPVEPYLTVELSSAVHGVGSRKDIDQNLNIIDEAFDVPHVTPARDLFIDALRQFREMNPNSNSMKDLRTEVFPPMYEEPIHPKNLWLEQDPVSHAQVDEVYRADIRRSIERGSFTPPPQEFEGAKLYPMDPDLSPAEAWTQARELWEKPDA